MFLFRGGEGVALWGGGQKIFIFREGVNFSGGVSYPSAYYVSSCSCLIHRDQNSISY